MKIFWISSMETEWIPKTYGISSQYLVIVLPKKMGIFLCNSYSTSPLQETYVANITHETAYYNKFTIFHPLNAR